MICGLHEVFSRGLKIDSTGDRSVIFCVKNDTERIAGDTLSFVEFPSQDVIHWVPVDRARWARNAIFYFFSFSVERSYLEQQWNNVEKWVHQCS